MNNLASHADRELRVAGYSPDTEDSLDRQIYVSTMEIVEAFSKCGHSGGSAWAHTYMINQLLQFKPLGPITDNPDEWMEVSDMMGPDQPATWQSIRNSSMFSTDRGKTYYSVNELRSGWKRKLFGARGKIYKSMEAKEMA